MAEPVLNFEDGEVTIGNDLVPGVLYEINIRGSVRFDLADRDGLSGKSKTPMGWADADITIALELLTDGDGDCYDKLTVIDRLFRGTDKGANPKVLTVANRHCRARGIKRVIFSALESRESDQDDVIMATLSFIEHVPAVVKKEKQVVASKTATPTVQMVPSHTQTATKILKDDDSSFFAGIKAGMGGN